MNNPLALTFLSLMLSSAAFSDAMPTDDMRSSINDDIKIILAGDASGAKLDDYSIHKHPDNNEYYVTKVLIDPSLDTLTEFNVRGAGEGTVSIHLLVAKNWTQQCNITIQDSAKYPKPLLSVEPECASNWRVSDILGQDGHYHITITSA